jgi:hypothetical protein
MIAILREGALWLEATDRRGDHNIIALPSVVKPFSLADEPLIFS